MFSAFQNPINIKLIELRKRPHDLLDGRCALFRFGVWGAHALRNFFGGFLVLSIESVHLFFAFPLVRVTGTAASLISCCAFSLPRSHARVLSPVLKILKSQLVKFAPFLPES